MGSRSQPGGGGPKPANTPTGDIKLPPPPPPRRFEPIDPALRRDAESEISKAYAAPDAVVRANAIEATQRTSGPAGAPRLVAALTDPAPLVRFAGAMACGTLKLENAHDRLSTMAGDRDVSVQVAVRFALHRLGDTKLSHDFELFSKDPSAGVRANTAMALGLLGEPSALKVLKPMMADLDRKVRMQVVEAMYRLGDEDARNQLVTGTLSVYPDEQIICVLALAGPKNPEVLRNLRAALTAEQEETRLAAARAVGMLGSDDGMTIAIKAADNKDPRQRGMAALALGDIGRSDAQDELKSLLRDKSPAVPPRRGDGGFAVEGVSSLISARRLRDGWGERRSESRLVGRHQATSRLPRLAGELARRSQPPNGEQARRLHVGFSHATVALDQR